MDGTQRQGAAGRIGDLASPVVATIVPTATLREAADAMMADGLGLLVISDVNGPLGVLSERDVVAAISDELDVEVERVRDHGSGEMIGVDADASVVDAAQAMAEAQIRHLVVLSDGDVVGVVSIRDVLRALVD